MLDKLEAQVKVAEASIPKTPEWQMERMAQLLDRLEKAQNHGGQVPAEAVENSKNVRRASMRQSRPPV